jgi:hypothetical protein
MERERRRRRRRRDGKLAWRKWWKWCGMEVRWV